MFSRRTVIHLITLSALAAAHAVALVPVDPRCEGIHNPPDATATPRLSWRVETDARGDHQSAWQVLVASSPDRLAENQGDLWDSKKTPATREPWVRYAGAALAPGTPAHWKVRVWNRDDVPSDWSTPAMFTVAPEQPSDWHGARWISDGKPLPERDEDFYETDPAPLMRREFTIDKPVVRARLHVAGLGYCLPSLNGMRIADHVLDPPWTHFDKRILYRTHDVTDLLEDGGNCLGIALGNGWYNPLPLRMWGHRNIRESLPIGRPRAIALLVAEHPDGSETIVTTGPDWHTTEGPTLKNSIFLGEKRDARLAIPGWDRAGFAANAWRPVNVADAPLEPLQPILSMPPVREGVPLAAVAVTTPQPGLHIVDFGENFTGVPEMNLRAPGGTEILLRFGELLYDDGTLNVMTSVCGQIKGTRTNADGIEVSVGGPGAPTIAWQQDVFITSDAVEETYRPDFTFHAFRFMEITGLPEAPKPEDFRGVRLNSELPDAGEFSSSNDMFNQLQKVVRNTMLANVVSVQSDCPHRERFGYGGDIVASYDAFLMNFDMHGFYAKTVRDWQDAAHPDGRFTDTAPFVGIDYCGVGWAMVHPLLLEQLHIHYGDRDLIAEQLPAAILWFDGEAGRRQNGLVTTGLGDHESLTGSRGPVLSTPMFIDTAQRMARLARLVDMKDAATRFDRYAAESIAAWKEAFLDAENGKVGAATQSDQLFALGFHAAPDDSRPQVFDRLLDALMAAEDAPRLTTGIYGTRILMEELPAGGRNDLAYALADRRTFPSWGWMLENDATTLWEDWRGTDGAKSHNHPMFGMVSAWFFRWLGGIQPAEDAVGFDRIVIRPQVEPQLEWVKTSHRSIRGPIVSNWKVTDAGVEYEIVIPPDATATIELPKTQDDTITESGAPLAQAPGIILLEATSSLHRIQVGGGTYRFLVTTAR